jgi:DNA-binding MarR family transcriptional regulator
METSTLSRTLDRLRDKGFIDILRDDKDGRAQQLHLTSKAYELLRRGIAPWEKAQQKATQLLGSGGVALIHRIDQAIDADS